MKAYKVILEVVCDASSPDWIEVAINDQLEAGEAIVSFEYKEIENA